MKVTVGSVFSESDRNPHWHSLQIKNLNCPHVVYPNCSDSFPGSTVLKRVGKATGQLGHVEGLNELISYFKTTDSDFYLILDSDCFPIHNQWLAKLAAVKNDVAAIVRYENLDSFAHPSAFFFKKEVLFKVQFGLNDVQNITGDKFKEVTSNIKEFFPLIRTNRWNPHPIMFGIYWNLFYHHGAGSRTPMFRAIHDLKYYKDLEINNLQESHFKKLVTNPEEYISQLNFEKKRKVL